MPISITKIICSKIKWSIMSEDKVSSDEETMESLEKTDKGIKNTSKNYF